MGVLALLLAFSSLACICGGLARRTPVPTATRVAVSTPTPVTPTPVATLAIGPTPSTQTGVPSPVQGRLDLTNPPWEGLESAFDELSPGGEFRLIFEEAYVNSLILEHMDDIPDLPLELTDLWVDFVPDQIILSATVPLGFLRVEVTATGYWRAVDCQFEAEITDLRLGGQTAPASLREQIEPLLRDGLEFSQQAPGCFTQVEITQDVLIITGYKK